MRLDFVQPSWHRREWELRSGDEVVATLRAQAFRRGAVAEAGGRQLTIEREAKNTWVVRDEATGEERARLLKRALELGGQSLEWKRLGRGKGHGFVGADGEPLARARITTGLTRMHGEVELNDGAAEDDALIAGLMASFLLVRKGDATSGAVAASVAASA